MNQSWNRRWLRGGASLLLTLVIGVAVGMAAMALYNTERHHQRAVIRRIGSLESFYTNEAAQWQGYERTRRGLDIGVAPDAAGRFTASLQNRYAAIGGTLAVISYNHADPDGTPYNLRTTAAFDVVTSDGVASRDTLNQRLRPNTLFYQLLDR